MSIYAGPNITTLLQTNLDTVIDPANDKCWTPATTAVRDIGPRRLTAAFSSTPSTTESAQQTRAWTLSGTNRITGFSQTLSGTGSKTIVQWFYTTSGSTRQGLSGTRPSAASDGWVLGFNRNAVGNLHYFHTGGSAIDLAAGITANRWIMASVVYASLTNLAILYVNGELVGSQGSFSGMSTPTYAGCLGDEDGGFSTPLLGRLGLSIYWSQALQAADINTIYNNTRSRYGL